MDKDIIKKELYAIAKMFKLWQEQTNNFLEEIKNALMSILGELKE